MLSGISTVLVRAARRFFGFDSGYDAAMASATSEMAQMAAILRQREASGQTTELRQLHALADLSQPQALTTVRSLEQAGIITIEPDMADAFASRIRLSEQARTRPAHSSAADED